MADARAKNGGAREGAGRKAKVVEADLQRRLKKACKDGETNLLDEVFRRLVQDAMSDGFRVRNESRKLLLAYFYGKPVQRVLVEDDTPDDGKGRLDLSKLSTEELEVLERAGEIVARTRRGASGKGSA